MREHSITHLCITNKNTLVPIHTHTDNFSTVACTTQPYPFSFPQNINYHPLFENSIYIYIHRVHTVYINKGRKEYDTHCNDRKAVQYGFSLSSIDAFGSKQPTTPPRPSTTPFHIFPPNPSHTKHIGFYFIIFGYVWIRISTVFWISFELDRPHYKHDDEKSTGWDYPAHIFLSLILQNSKFFEVFFV